MDGTMRKLAVIATLCAAVAHGICSAAVPDDAWVEAARAALQIMHSTSDAIVVIDDSLPEPAQHALASLGQTVSFDALPEKEEYILPPRPYLRMRQFELHGEQFEFTIAVGAIPRNAHNNCGDTEHFFVARDAQGAWNIAGLRSSTVC